MRRGVLLLVIAGAIALLASCAGDPIDEAMLPTRVPELDMQALVRNAEAARPTPLPTPTDTPIPAPEPVESDASDAADAPSKADESVVINNGDPVVRSESPETTEKEDAQPAAESAEVAPATDNDIADTEEPETTESNESESSENSPENTTGFAESITDDSPEAEKADSADGSAETDTDGQEPASEESDDSSDDAISGPSEAVGTAEEADSNAQAVTGGSEETTEAGDSLMEAIEDADLEQGEQLTLSTGCTSCHSMDPNHIGVGPTWYNLAATSANRVDGESAEYYIYKSIITHDAYIVEGFENSAIPPTLKETFSDQQIADIIGYLLAQRAR